MFINTSERQSWVFGLDFNPMGLYSRPDEVRMYAQENWSLPAILKTTNSNIGPGFVNNVLLGHFRTAYRFHTRKEHYFAFQYSFSYYRICKTNEHPQRNSINNFGKGFTPADIGDGWILSSPVHENMDSLKLDKVFKYFYREDRFLLGRSLTIIRNGKIVAEAYSRETDDIHQIQNIKSATKAFTGILACIAL
ncbi:MAG: hypothetical protein V2B15_05445 [Bacteroidota bacterium]